VSEQFLNGTSHPLSVVQWVMLSVRLFDRDGQTDAQADSILMAMPCVALHAVAR